MPAHRAAAALACAVLAGCAMNSAPRGWLPAPDATTQRGFGGWAEMSYQQGRRRLEARGELLAIDRDTVYLLGAGGLTRLPADAVRSARVVYFNSESERIAGWALLGTASTASHGIVLILTAPAWVLTGSIIAAVESYAPVVQASEGRLTQLRPYARFPQGMPPGLDASSLRVATSP